MTEARDVVLAYWDAMRGNDFTAAAEWLDEDVVIDWPQSRERIIGRANFAALNTAYPANGPWTFTLNRVVSGKGPAGVDEVVTDVTISDGTVTVRAITFHEVRGRAIIRQTEYWPDDYTAPEWRAAWVERY